jgi:magnesium chelatase family protein
MDRIDIQLRVSRVTAVRLRLGDENPSASTAAARRRVTDARAAAAERLAGTPWRLNSQVPGAWLRSRERRLGPATTASIDRALERGGLTMRGYDRVLRLGWSVADLAEATIPTADHIGRALYLRRAL